MTLAREEDSRVELSEVGRTAAAVAVARAAEAERDDPWFIDPLAEELVSRLGPDLENVPGVGRGLRSWIAVRTRFLDELILAACADGIRQVVIVGAGLDARAFRLRMPAGTTVYEVDRSDILAVKSETVAAAGIAPLVERHVVVTDLTDPDWIARLEESGWSPAEPSVWLLEGLLIYFDRDTRLRLLSAIAAVSPAGSVLGATTGNGSGSDRHPLWKPFDDDDLFAASGWPASLLTMAEASERYGRSLPTPAGFSGMLLSARRDA